MNLTRLMALGILARSGPSHGHHIRRVADVTNVGEWGGVSVGALYRDLRAMEREGLVEAERTEKVGNRPERTVYAITPEGHLELTTLREQAVRPLPSGPDPLGVALLFAADGMEPEELRRNLRARRDMMTIAVAQVAADREQLIAKGVLNVLAAAVMRRAIMTAEAEIRWHDELDAELAKVGGDALARSGGGRVGGPGGGPLEAALPRQAAIDTAAEEPGGTSAADASPRSMETASARPGGTGPTRGRPANADPASADPATAGPASAGPGGAGFGRSGADGGERAVPNSAEQAIDKSRQ